MGYMTRYMMQPSTKPKRVCWSGWPAVRKAARNLHHESEQPVQFVGRRRGQGRHRRDICSRELRSILSGQSLQPDRPRPWTQHLGGELARFSADGRRGSRRRPLARLFIAGSRSKKTRDKKTGSLRRKPAPHGCKYGLSYGSITTNCCQPKTSHSELQHGSQPFRVRRRTSVRRPDGSVFRPGRTALGMGMGWSITRSIPSRRGRH